MIPMTQDLKKSVRSAHLAYKAHLERGKEVQEKKEKSRVEKEISDRLKKEREKLIEEKESLAKK